MDPASIGIGLLGIVANAIIASTSRQEMPKIEEPGVEFQDPGALKKKLSAQGGLPGQSLPGWGSAGSFGPDVSFSPATRIAGAKSLQKKLYGQ
jgi:hypothetical protein